MQAYIEDKEHIIVVGGGFIGIEFVELFAKMGKKLTLIIREKWYWQGMIDQLGGNMINEYIIQKARVLYETELTAIEGENGQISEISLNNGETILADAICIGVGLELNKDFLPPELCNRGLRVNQYLVSEDENILAAGDIAEYYDVLSGQYTSGGTWANASLQGIMAGYNMVHPEMMKEFSLIPAYCPKTSLPIAFVGNCRMMPDMQCVVIEQGDRYVQVTVNTNGVIVGAAAIGDSAYMGVMRKWVSEKRKIEDI